MILFSVSNVKSKKKKIEISFLLNCVKVFCKVSDVLKLDPNSSVKCSKFTTFRKMDLKRMTKEMTLVLQIT